MIATIQLLNTNIYAQCMPGAISQTDVTKAIVSITYNGEKFTGTLVNNYDEDGEYYLITSMLPFHAFCGSSPSSYISDISFKWHNGQSTSGAYFLSNWLHDDFVAILRLEDSPPYETISYLGISQGGNGVRCIANYNTSLVEYEVANSTYGNISVNCNSGISFDFVSTSGSDATVINKWYYYNLDDDSNPLGAPLLNTYEQVVGIYVAKSGGIYEEPIYNSDDEIIGYNTICGEDTAFFVKYFVDPTSGGVLNSNIPAVKIKPCAEILIEEELIDVSKTIKANVRIIGRSKIDNVQVRFKAGQEVILENGFDSGNDFIASIEPCEPIVTPLAKTESSTNNNETIEESKETSLTNSISAYPTINVDNYLIIESEGIQNLNYSLFSLAGKLVLADSYVVLSNSKYSKRVELPSLSQGIYLLQINNGTEYKTIKILKE